MEKAQLVSKIVFAAAIVYLATSLILFVNEAERFRVAIDNLVEQVSATSSNMNMPELLQRVDAATHEIEQTRELVPKVLEQMERTREAIPPVLKEMEQTRQMIPSILAESAEIREQIPKILTEVKETRESVPGVLNEVAAVRQDLPGILDKSQTLIAEAQKVSSEMGTGVVHGTVKGVVTAPLKIIETGIETVGSGIETVNSTASKLIKKGSKDDSAKSNVSKEQSK